MNKKFIALVCAALTVGLIIGVVSFQGDLSNTYRSYTVEADLVQAYFHVFNVSRDAPVDYARLVAYVVLLNITNPSSQTLRINDLRMILAENGSRSGTSFSFGGGSVDYKRDFASDNNDNYWYPHTSRLVAFSATSGATGLDLNIFEAGKGVFYSYIYFALDEGRGGGSTIIFENITLQSLGNEEYVYGNMFGAGHYFSFRGDSISTGWESGRFG